MAKYFYNKYGELHREDGPAYIEDGCEEWFFNNLLHREDGPACTYYYTGARYWYQYGRRHRLDGPAVIFNNGQKLWYYKGKQVMAFSQEEFEKKLKLKAFW